MLTDDCVFDPQNLLNEVVLRFAAPLEAAGPCFIDRPFEEDPQIDIL